MPYPNHHSCRVRNPGDFQKGSFVTIKREHDGKPYNVIMGRLKGEDTLTEQAYRYPKEHWTEAAARAHCKSHDGILFEPASESQSSPQEDLELRGAIPYRKYPLAPEDEPWDAAREVAAADVDDLKQMCAWYDSKNPDVKTSYKLPHHRQRDKHTVWRAVAASMAALRGARGGVAIPSGDRAGVYAHLKKHYAEFDKEPPELNFDAQEEIERRSRTCEFRVQETESETPVLEGYAALFNVPMRLFRHVEVIAPGAFTKTLASKPDVRATVNHDPSFVLGRLKAGTLELEEDAKGLKVRIKPPDTQWVRDLLQSIKRGDIDQMSFAFRTIQDEWQVEDDQDLRILREVSLDDGDVSIVTYPACPDTTVALRSRERWEERQRQQEERSTESELARMYMRLRLAEAEAE